MRLFVDEVVHSQLNELYFEQQWPLYRAAGTAVPMMHHLLFVALEASGCLMPAKLDGAHAAYTVAGHAPTASRADAPLSAAVAVKHLVTSPTAAVSPIWPSPPPSAVAMEPLLGGTRPPSTVAAAAAASAAAADSPHLLADGGDRTGLAAPVGQHPSPGRAAAQALPSQPDVTGVPALLAVAATSAGQSPSVVMG